MPTGGISTIYRSNKGSSQIELSSSVLCQSELPDLFSGLTPMLLRHYKEVGICTAITQIPENL